MADPRVHPTAADTSPPPPSSASATNSGEHPVPPNPPPSKPVPPPPTYVFQIPREQILRYPPPENSRKFETLTRRGKRGTCCRRCCCFTLCALILLAIAAAISAGALYLVFRFKSPKYAVTHLAIKGMNLTSSAPISPEFDVTIRAENPNSKVGIYYLKGSGINVFFNDVKFSDGILPVFYQPKENVTVFKPALTGPGVKLGSAVKDSLINAQNERKIPFVVKTKVPVKIKVGAVRTWRVTVKAKCDVVVDSLNEKAKIVSNDCHYRVRLW